MLRPLHQLITLRRFATGAQLTEAVQQLPDVPESWKKVRRQVASEEQAAIRIKVSVQELAATCNRHAVWFANFGGSETCRFCVSSSNDRLFFAGLDWCISLQYVMSTSGSHIGVYITPFANSWDSNDPPANVDISIKAHVVCNATSSDCWGEWIYVLGSKVDAGWLDFWDVGFMPNAWDEAAWAAKGLPLSGDLVAELRHLIIR